MATHIVNLHYWAKHFHVFCLKEEAKLEIVRSLKMSKSGKATDPNNIPSEALKAAPIYQHISSTACLGTESLSEIRYRTRAKS